MEPVLEEVGREGVGNGHDDERCPEVPYIHHPRS